jgi:membrane dipeptidase
MTAHDHCFPPGDFDDMESGGVTVRTIKLTEDPAFWWHRERYRIDSEVEGWEHRGKMAIEILEKEAQNSQGKVIIVRSVADIERAKREHKLGVIMSFEGARPLEGKLENVKMFYDLGLRDLEFFLPTASAVRSPDGTLSDFGLRVIKEMDRLGMVIDLSHMSGNAFAQALATTHNPIILSHCGIAAVSLGNSSSTGTDQLGDDTIRAIAKNGGVICLHFYDVYIHPHHGAHATVEDLVDHIDYIKRLVGIDYVGLGPDYFPEDVNSRFRVGARFIEGAENMRDMPNIAREMVRRGYTDPEIQKVLGLNLLRLYGKVWGDAKNTAFEAH